MQDLYNNYNPDISGLYPKRSKFDLSHPFTFSGRLGVLYPTLVQEIIPGDTVDLDILNEVRFAPTIAPVNWEFKVKSAAFFIPHRQTWARWEEFITGAKNGQTPPNNQELTPIKPNIRLPVNNYTGETDEHRSVGDLFDFIYGSATPENYDSISEVSKSGKVKVDSTPCRAYYKVINDWYKVENLDEDLEIFYNRDGGAPDPIAYYKLQKARYEKDYFTASNPWLTKGGSVEIPITTREKAPVLVNDVPLVEGNRNPVKVSTTSGSTINGSYSVSVVGHSGVPPVLKKFSNQAGAVSDEEIYFNNLYVNLHESIALGINELRTAFQTRKFLQREARAGNRYIESILAHFGVRASDYRLQRSQYLGGVVSDVASTALYQSSSSDAVSPQGNQTGILYSAGANKNHIRMSFEEHGWLMVLTWVVPRTGYYQGIPRQFTRETRWDYYWREFAELDEQAILNKEIYVDGESRPGQSRNDGVFGYIGRYDDMRQRQARIAGEMRTTQSYWQYARKFTAMPNLNSEFCKYDGDDRIFAVSSRTADPIWFNQRYIMYLTRPMPLTNDPGLLDHH